MCRVARVRRRAVFAAAAADRASRAQPSFPWPLHKNTHANTQHSKCKLYRFESDEWKERGIGQARLLKHKENGKTRLLMRQEKTLKIRANHIGAFVVFRACACEFVCLVISLQRAHTRPASTTPPQKKPHKITRTHTQNTVMPSAQLQEHTGSDKAWVWSTVDFAEGEQRVELFCIRFGSPEKAQEFKKAFEAAKEANAALIGAGGAPVATATAGDAEADAEADKLAAEVEAKAAVKEDEAAA